MTDDTAATAIVVSGRMNDLTLPTTSDLSENSACFAEMPRELHEATTTDGAVEG
ncbi:hypothetical protein OG218_09080 [Kineococcus sp. NBC_00420]|uniref:hypothetical protein n=1 Tax=Kineococcus sp. NBC_00420 TaxID=2903564 RepID=UPI002E1D4BD9